MFVISDGGQWLYEPVFVRSALQEDEPLGLGVIWIQHRSFREALVPVTAQQPHVAVAGRRWGGIKLGTVSPTVHGMVGYWWSRHETQSETLKSKIYTQEYGLGFSNNRRCFVQ